MKPSIDSITRKRGGNRNSSAEGFGIADRSLTQLSPLQLTPFHVSLMAVGFKVFKRVRLSKQCKQVLPVAALDHRLGKYFQLLGGDESLPVRDLLRARDAQA